MLTQTNKNHLSSNDQLHRQLDELLQETEIEDPLHQLSIYHRLKTRFSKKSIKHQPQSTLVSPLQNHLSPFVNVNQASLADVGRVYDRSNYSKWMANISDENIYLDRKHKREVKAQLVAADSTLKLLPSATRKELRPFFKQMESQQILQQQQLQQQQMSDSIALHLKRDNMFRRRTDLKSMSDLGQARVNPDKFHEEILLRCNHPSSYHAYKKNHHFLPKKGTHVISTSLPRIKDTSMNINQSATTIQTTRVLSPSPPSKATVTSTQQLQPLLPMNLPSSFAPQINSSLNRSNRLFVSPGLRAVTTDNNKYNLSSISSQSSNTNNEDTPKNYDKQKGSPTKPAEQESRRAATQIDQRIRKLKRLASALNEDSNSSHMNNSSQSRTILKSYNSPLRTYQNSVLMIDPLQLSNSQKKKQSGDMWIVFDTDTKSPKSSARVIPSEDQMKKSTILHEDSLSIKVKPFQSQPSHYSRSLSMNMSTVKASSYLKTPRKKAVSSHQDLTEQATRQQQKVDKTLGELTQKVVSEMSKQQETKSDDEDNLSDTSNPRLEHPNQEVLGKLQRQLITLKQIELESVETQLRMSPEKEKKVLLQKRDQLSQKQTLLNSSKNVILSCAALGQSMEKNARSLLKIKRNQNDDIQNINVYYSVLKRHDFPPEEQAKVMVQMKQIEGIRDKLEAQQFAMNYKLDAVNCTIDADSIISKVDQKARLKKLSKLYAHRRLNKVIHTSY